MAAQGGPATVQSDTVRNSRSVPENEGVRGRSRCALLPSPETLRGQISRPSAKGPLVTMGKVCQERAYQLSLIWGAHRGNPQIRTRSTVEVGVTRLK